MQDFHPKEAVANGGFVPQNADALMEIVAAATLCKLGFGSTRFSTASLSL